MAESTMHRDSQRPPRSPLGSAGFPTGPTGLHLGGPSEFDRRANRMRESYPIYRYVSRRDGWSLFRIWLCLDFAAGVVRGWGRQLRRTLPPAAIGSESQLRG